MDVREGTKKNVIAGICPARTLNAGSGLYTKFDQNYIINMNCTEVYIMELPVYVPHAR